ncbi:MAG: hypothetical protein KIT73_04425 [Burkholderiales bacterium]|nr:hypothetical protein [Burkholderiales bacterium]
MRILIFLCVGTIAVFAFLVPTSLQKDGWLVFLHSVSREVGMAIAVAGTREYAVVIAIVIIISIVLAWIVGMTFMFVRIDMETLKEVEPWKSNRDAAYGMALIFVLVFTPLIPSEFLESLPSANFKGAVLENRVGIALFGMSFFCLYMSSLLYIVWCIRKYVRRKIQ